MEKFGRLKAIAVQMMRDNIDTDTIIPVPYLKDPNSDFGKHLFHNWRYEADDSENPNFVLNFPQYRKAQIIVAGKNFGCGSSREHAVWALAGFGIRCVIADGFGGVFYDSSVNQGLLPVVLPHAQVRAIGKAVEAVAGTVDTVIDLNAQTVTSPDGAVYGFEMEATRRRMLLEGLDAVGITLLHAGKIESFEQQRRAARPWVYDIDLKGGTRVR